VVVGLAVVVAEVGGEVGGRVFQHFRIDQFQSQGGWTQGLEMMTLRRFMIPDG